MHTPSLNQMLSLPFSERKLERELEICDRARLVLLMCRYRRAPEQHYCYVKPACRHSVWGTRRGSVSIIIIHLASPMRWKEEVSGRSVSSASGYFVFEVVKVLNNESLIVIAAKQSRGCILTLAYGLARKERNRWLLSFSGLPAKFKTSPPNPQKRGERDYYRLAEWQRMSEEFL